MTGFRQLVPVTLKHLVRASPLFVRHRTRYTTIFHCCVYRTGSQWLKRLLSDRRVHRYSGLSHEFRYERVFGTGPGPDQTGAGGFPFARAFATGTILSVYAGYEAYLRIPKPEKYRTVYVVRDPRDIVVSHYFASRRDAAREPESVLSRQMADIDTGLPLMIDMLEKMELFAAMRSWASAADDARVSVLRFEDLIGPGQFRFFQHLLTHCDIAMPAEKLRALLADHSFETMTGGRKTGQEDAASHYRKGIAGDWRNHLTGRRLEHFHAVTGDLTALLGYE